MANPTILVQVGHPDPLFHPATIDELCTGTGGLKDLITATLQGSYTIYVTGSSVPSVGDQDKIWFKYDAQGRPIGIYKYYAGNWRKVYTEPLGSIKLFSGDSTGLFDGTGLGIINTEWDGWALLNGNNGTTDLSDKFIIASNTYSSGWKTTVTGTSLQTGGASTITLDANTTYRPATSELKVGLIEADGNHYNSAAGIYGKVDTTTPANNITLIGGDTGKQDPDPITTVPPFFALAYVIFKGFA